MIVKETTSTKSPIYEDALSIRHEVFITEQNVPFEREIEGEEGKQYFVGYVGTTAAVCARAFLESPGIWHVQRVACRKEYRGKHLASELMRFIEEKASDSGIKLLPFMNDSVLKRSAKVFLMRASPIIAWTRKSDLQKIRQCVMMVACDESRGTRQLRLFRCGG